VVIAIVVLVLAVVALAVVIRWPRSGRDLSPLDPDVPPIRDYF
jgi:hypothetical protein